ncbi:MAG: Crp/Fnr family transcriptional regulator [Bacteroidota bacterium]
MTEEKLETGADLLFRTLNYIAPLPPELAAHFRDHLRTRKVPKKHPLLSPGEVGRHIYFIVSGFTRAYFRDRHGDEHTCWFMGTGDVMIPVHSFFTQQPSQEYLETLSETTLLSLTWEEVQGIYAKFPAFNFHGRILTEKYYILAEERAILLRTKRPTERFALLLEQHPGIMTKATNREVASFLGINEATLSRIRSARV